MKYGSRQQKAATMMVFVRLPKHERQAIRKLAEHDELHVSDYVIRRINETLYADNGFSMVYDVTHTRNIDADSIEEAATKGGSA